MTATTDQAAITTAIQTAAANDLARLQAFVTANTAAYNTLRSNLVTLAGSLSSGARSAAVLAIRDELMQSLADFQTLVSTTTAAQTAIPVA